MAEPGSREWYWDPKIPVETKRAVAKARALAGPQAKWWTRWYQLADDVHIITETGRVFRLSEDGRFHEIPPDTPNEPL